MKIKKVKELIKNQETVKNILKIIKFNFGKIKLRIKSFLFQNKKNIISEKSKFILFPDLSADDMEIPDLFARTKIADEITTTILTSKGQMSFLISGEWGIGKTSILKFIQKKLIRKRNIKYILFSPWKYSGGRDGANAISRAFITILAKELRKQYITKDLYTKKQVERERNLLSQLIILIWIIIQYFIYISVIFCILLFIISKLLVKFPKLQEVLIQFISSPEGQFKVLGIVSAILALPPLGQYFISRIREQGQIEKISSPELFEQKFDEIINDSIKIKYLQYFLNLWEETLSKTLLAFLGKPIIGWIFYRHHFSFLKYEKFVIFIDDLDRCNEEEVREFLSGMKTFFEHSKVYYIIAADIDKLRDKISGKEPEFLRKIIQLDWNVPFLQENEVKEYVRDLLISAKALEELKRINASGFNQLTIILQLHPNPRKIKYYLRRLLFLLNILKGEIKVNEKKLKSYPYLLKLIILAASDNKSYLYFLNNPNLVSQIEKGSDLPDVLLKVEDLSKKEENKLQENKFKKTKQLLQLLPHSDDLEIDMTKLFSLVGFLEEQPPNPTEFLELGKTDPGRAIKLVEKMAESWIYFMKLALSSINQSFEAIKNESEKTDDQDFIKSLKNEITSITMLLEKFANRKREEDKKLTNDFLISLPELNQNITKILNDNETKILNLALFFDYNEFWEQYLAIERFNDFNNFNQIINNLDNQSILDSNSLNPILVKTFSFLDSNLNDVINLIKNKKFFENKNSKDFQKQVTNYFTLQDDERRNKLFNLFKESRLDRENQLMIINDLIEKNDCQRLKDCLSHKSFSQILISGKPLEKLKDFLINTADLNNQKCKELIIELFKPDNFEKYNIKESKFLNDLSEKVKNMIDQSLKDDYVSLFLQFELVNIVKENNMTKDYCDILTKIKPAASTKIKGEVTRFINRKLKGKKYGKRKTTRRKRRK